MSGSSTSSDVPAVKDESRELPVPSAWRPVFCEIVEAFVDRDYRLSSGVAGVAPISNETAEQIEEYIDDYGETLVALPDDTWATSVSLWMGDRWDVLVDLWTRGEGRSDMVLSAQVSETGAGYTFRVYMVYVP